MEDSHTDLKIIPTTEDKNTTNDLIAGWLGGAGESRRVGFWWDFVGGTAVIEVGRLAVYGVFDGASNGGIHLGAIEEEMEMIDLFSEMLF